MSTNFVVSRDDIITAALRGVGALDKGEGADTDDILDCAFSLNLILKSWVATGMPLWKVVQIPVPTVQGLAVYTIGPGAHGPGAVSTDRPLRILEAYLRDSNNHDRIVEIVARSIYNELGDKYPSNSDINYIWYQPGVNVGSVTVYPPAKDSTSTLYLSAQVPIQDVTVGTDILDFPSECYQALKWNLMDEIAEDYHCSDMKCSRIERKAKMYKEQMENWSQEEASLYLSFDAHSR